MNGQNELLSTDRWSAAAQFGCRQLFSRHSNAMDSINDIVNDVLVALVIESNGYRLAKDIKL